MGTHQGKNVKTLREGAGMTQVVAAKAAGVSRVTWARWEAAKRLPQGRAEEVAELFGVDTDIVTGKDTLSVPAADGAVETPTQLNRWLTDVFRSGLPQAERLILLAIGTFTNTSVWVAPVSVQAIVEETEIDPDVVDEAWDRVISSEWLQRIDSGSGGKYVFTFRLKFPDNDQRPG